MNLRAAQVYIIMMFMTALASSTMFVTHGIYFVAELGLNPVQLVLMGTVLELTVLLFEGITGVVADTYSRRRSVIIGMFIIGAGFMLEGSVMWIGAVVPVLSIFAWVLVAEFIWGVGHTFISGADSAWIVDEVGESNVGNLFLKAKRVSLLGNLLGIGLSVGMSTIAPNLPYVLGGLIYASLGVFLLLFMKETAFVGAVQEQQGSHWEHMKSTWLSGASTVRRHPILLMIVGVTLFSGAASEGYDRLWEMHLITGIGFPAEIPLSMPMWFGLIAVLSTLISIAAVRITENRLDMGNERAVFVAMFMLTAFRIAGIVALAFSPNLVWALGSILIVGVVQTLSQPIYETWLNMNIESKSRATVLSMISQTDALGQTAGGPVVGWVGSRVSVRASLITAAVLLGPILTVFSRALRRK
ncbi:MFS transporter [Paenibacillus sp. ACRRX]|uniref:MFS transporter n=1 Tax=Paenibacillus sp. ACRRX TaxID=2918206 RepID=UPI001EF6C3AB|nr:MFS transporter [Paenibacillus sp. ACRRX]MCG7408242.1 MFS transporter [Paenibacillus sp. ACRRX]